MSSFSSSEAASPDATVSLAFDKVSLRFRRHQASRQFRQIALDALRRRPQPRAEDIWLYRGLSFSIDHGARVGIIGGNGVGKSTLLKLILGVYAPTGGQILVRGRVSGLIELGAGFNHELSGPENIILAGAFQGFGSRETKGKVERILAFAGLLGSRTLPIKYYSSGMLLRLAFAIATDIEPEILLLDEIFGVGDAEFAERAMRRLQRLLDASHIAVIVSHDLALIERFCTRAMWLRAGEIIESGDPPAVCQAYRRFSSNASRLLPT